LGSGWESHIKIGESPVDSVFPIERYVFKIDGKEQLPTLDKWMIYTKEHGFFISFNDYTLSKGSLIKLPILKKYVNFYSTHFSYLQGFR